MIVIPFKYFFLARALCSTRQLIIFCLHKNWQKEVHTQEFYSASRILYQVEQFKRICSYFFKCVSKPDYTLFAPVLNMCFRLNYEYHQNCNLNITDIIIVHFIYLPLLTKLWNRTLKSCPPFLVLSDSSACL